MYISEKTIEEIQEIKGTPFNRRFIFNFDQQWEEVTEPFRHASIAKKNKKNKNAGVSVCYNC